MVDFNDDRMKENQLYCSGKVNKTWSVMISLKASVLFQLWVTSVRDRTFSFIYFESYPRHYFMRFKAIILGRSIFTLKLTLTPNLVF